MRAKPFTACLFCLTLLGIWLIQPTRAAPTAAAPNSPAASTDLPALFRKVDGHFERIQTMDLKVERSLERGMRKQKDKWRVYFRKPGDILLDYEGPPQRLVLTNGEDYTEYIPEAKKALELKFSEMSAEQKTAVMMQLMPRIAIPGFRLALDERNISQLHFKIIKEVSVDDRPAYYIEGAASKLEREQTKKKMKIWIDRERATLLRVEVYDGDQFVSSIENKNFKELEKGLWLPTEIIVKNSTPQAMEKASYEIARIIVNQAITDKTFSKPYGEGVQVSRGETQNPPEANVKTP